MKKNKVVLSGKPDRKEIHYKRFINSVIMRTIGCFAASILLGFFLGGANMENTFTLIESIRSGTVNFDRIKGCLVVGLIASIIASTYAYENYLKMKNTRVGEEHGSSKLMAAKDLPNFNLQFLWDPNIVKKHESHIKTHYDNDNIKVVCNKTPKKEDTYKECFLNSQIMGQNIYLSMNTKFINRNLNSITIGGSGQGKSFSELFPNALSANSNYIFTDPSGEIYQKIGKFLESQGYELKVFNVDEFNLSMAYNPLMYIQSESDYNIVVDALVENINTEKKNNSGNDFFDKAAKSLDCALIALLRELYPAERENITEERVREIRDEKDDYGNYPYKEKTDDEIIDIAIERNKGMQTLSNVMNLLHFAKQEVDEQGQTFSTLDNLFKKLEEQNPHSYAAKMWRDFQVGDPKVCNEVIISSAADFGRYFNNPDIQWLTRKDELNLRDLASEKKCALFLVIPQSTASYNFLCAMIYSQLFDITEKAGKRYRDLIGGGDPKLPRHLSFWLDEFANIGKIPRFKELLAVVRKYNISINIIVQGLAQLKGLYPQSEWEVIMACLDTMIYLGGMEPSTVRWLSEKLGKETIKSISQNVNSKSTGESYQNTGRNLLTPDEIEQMPRSSELIFISGCKPILTRKYNLTEHPNYKYSGEADEANNLNMNERFSDNKVDAKVLDFFTLTDIDVEDFNFDTLKKPEFGLTKRQKQMQKRMQKQQQAQDQDQDQSQNSEGIQDENTYSLLEGPDYESGALTDEEKEKRVQELAMATERQNQSIATVVKRYGLTNFELYATGSNYEYESASNYTVEEFEGLETFSEAI